MKNISEKCFSEIWDLFRMKIKFLRRTKWVFVNVTHVLYIFRISSLFEWGILCSIMQISLASRLIDSGWRVKFFASFTFFWANWPSVCYSWFLFFQPYCGCAIKVHCFSFLVTERGSVLVLWLSGSGLVISYPVTVYFK